MEGTDEGWAESNLLTSFYIYKWFGIKYWLIDNFHPLIRQLSSTVKVYQIRFLFQNMTGLAVVSISLFCIVVYKSTLIAIMLSVSVSVAWQCWRVSCISKSVVKHDFIPDFIFFFTRSYCIIFPRRRMCHMKALFVCKSYTCGYSLINVGLICKNKFYSIFCSSF